MTLQSDAKFEEKMTVASKNHMTNLVNFNASSDKSENLLLLSIAHKVSAKKVQKIYTDMALKKNANFVEKLTFV